MKITFKLFAMLTDYLPQEARASNVMEIEVPDGATVGQLIERFALPPKLVHLVLVNGTYVEPAQRLARALQPGDTLAIWPPIAGG
jgi:molybdopterin converting factor small subunit